MKFGKEIKYNSEWRAANYPELSPVTCSPLLFSTVFNDDYFIKKYSELYKDNKNPGIIINSENIILRDYLPMLGNEQLNIIETNGKFTIPKETIIDLWEDTPDENHVYIYYLVVIGQSGFHKVALLQTRSQFYYIDTNNKTVFVYEQHELINQFPYNRLTNLSVLVNPAIPEFIAYKKENFLHIISE